MSAPQFNDAPKQPSGTGDERPRVTRKRGGVASERPVLVQESPRAVWKCSHVTVKRERLTRKRQRVTVKCNCVTRKGECVIQKGECVARKWTRAVPERKIPMSEEPVPVPEPPAPRKKRALSEQDPSIANDIAAARALLDAARAHAEIGPLLARRGYDAEALAEGDALQRAAQDTYTTRQTALAAQTAAEVAAQSAHSAAEIAYTDFRETVRARFPDRTDQTALGVTGALPRDREQLLTRARAGLAAAAQPPFADTLAVSGYDAEGLAAANTEMDAFAAALAARSAASGAALGATQTRNEAIRALRAWVSAFTRIARVALRARPDLQRTLGV